MAARAIATLGDLRRLTAHLSDDSPLAFQDETKPHFTTRIFVAPFRLTNSGTCFAKEEEKKGHNAKVGHEGLAVWDPPLVVFSDE